MKPLVSVIVPTRNSARTLRRCLECIKAQSYRNIEIIVVDNFSTDETLDIAKVYADKIIHQEGGMGVQINKGVKEARGEFIAFFDSDMYLTKNVIKECVEKTMEGYHAVIIPERVVSNSFWQKVRDFEKRFYEGDLDIEAARFYFKKVYLGVGGINEKLKGYRDYDIHQKVKKAGYKIARINSYIFHDCDVELISILKKRFNRSGTLKEYLKEHPTHFKSMVFRKTLFLNTIKMFYVDPAVAFGIIVLKIGEYAATGVGLIWYEIRKIFGKNIL